MGGNSKRTTDNEFPTVWRVAGTSREVMDISGGARTLACRWPSVYLTAAPLDTGNPDGTGKAFSPYSKGWLPYDQRVSPSKPLVRRLSRLLKRAFSANHLALELRRRPGADLSKISRPAPPTFAGRYRWSATHA